MVPLFNLADTIATIKDEAEHTLDKCGAVVIPKDDATANFQG